MSFFTIRENALIRRKLNHSPALLLLVVSFAAFVVYTGMYGFRKPFTVGLYEQWTFLGIPYKVCLVIAQVIGYMLSKFIGIRVIAAMQPQHRIQGILICILTAWMALFLFAVIPAPYNIVCMFLNGLPLGMVFGLVFGFLEGRKTTEIMGAFLASSFIFASGLAKTVGKWLLINIDVHDFWMPFVAGGIFLIPMLFALWLLKQTPQPNDADILVRTARTPMTKTERKQFVLKFGWLLLPIVISYMLFTIVRDFSEDFANELWTETGYIADAGIFVQTSSIITVIVLIVIASFFTIQSNLKAFVYTHYLVIIGLLLTLLATYFFHQQWLSPIVWMILSTTGLYLAYLPFNCLYFERMISTYAVKGNVGFVMYIADAFGYLGTVVVLLLKTFVEFQFSWVNFFSILFTSTAIIGIVLILFTVIGHLKFFKSINQVA
jgi:MFS family permease